MRLCAIPYQKQHDTALIAERCRRSLSQFVKHFWETVVPVPLVWNWHIDAICEHLQAVTEGHIRKLIINVPPGHAKSTIVSVLWPAWEWIDHPGEQSLFGSYDIGLALRDSQKCRTVFTSDKYKNMFRPSWKMNRDQNAKGFYTNSANGNRYTFGLNAGGNTGWRGDKMVIDDPNSVKERYNTRIKREAFDTYNTVLSTRVNNIAKSRFVIIQQRVSYDDFTGRLNEEGGYEVLSLPTYFKPSQRFVTSLGWTDPRKEEDELLFSAQFPKDELDYLEVKKLGPEAFAAQFQQQPFPAGGKRFNSDDFVYYERLGRDLVRLHKRNGVTELVKLNLCYTFVTVDFAASEKTTADWTVFSEWAVTKHFDMLLLNVHRGRWTEPKIVEKSIALYAPTGYNGKKHVSFLCEDNGLGLPIMQDMQSKGIPTIPVHIHRTDKIVRSATAAIRVQAGQIFFPMRSPSTPWMDEFEKELSEFPSGDHDDQVDTLSLAAEGVYQVNFIGLSEGENIKIEQKKAHEVMEGNSDKRIEIGKRFFKT